MKPTGFAENTLKQITWLGRVSWDEFTSAKLCVLMIIFLFRAGTRKIQLRDVYFDLGVTPQLRWSFFGVAHRSCQRFACSHGIEQSRCGASQAASPRKGGACGSVSWAISWPWSYHFFRESLQNCIRIYIMTYNRQEKVWEKVLEHCSCVGGGFINSKRNKANQACQSKLMTKCVTKLILLIQYS